MTNKKYKLRTKRMDRNHFNIMDHLPKPTISIKTIKLQCQELNSFTITMHSII